MNLRNSVIITVAILLKIKFSMAGLKNKKILVLIIGLLVVLVAVVWIIRGFRPEEPSVAELPRAERYILTSQVQAVDPVNGLIISSDPEDGSEITIKIGEETEVYRVVFPEEASGVFQTQRVSISLDQVRVGELFFVKSNDSFAGQNRLLNVDYIEFLP